MLQHSHAHTHINRLKAITIELKIIYYSLVNKYASVYFRDHKVKTCGQRNLFMVFDIETGAIQCNILNNII